MSTELAYLAGFLDGEGNIRIARNSKNAKGYYLRISATQVSVAPLALLQSRFGGYIYKRKHVQRRDGCIRRVPTSEWVLSGPRASQALRDLLPYLVVKRDAAIIGIDFQKIVRPRNGSRKALSTEELANRRFYALALTVRTNHQKIGGVGGSDEVEGR